MPSSYPSQNGRLKYDQFFIFGDSITQVSYDQRLGFGFGAALESGELLCLNTFGQSGRTVRAH
jgi:hypothetical protein